MEFCVILPPRSKIFSHGRGFAYVCVMAPGDKKNTLFPFVHSDYIVFGVFNFLCILVTIFYVVLRQHTRAMI